MTKTPKTRESLRAKFAKEKPSKGRLRPPPGERPAELDTVELMTAVCELICEGWPVAEIQENLENRYGSAGRLSREKVYDYLHRAGDEGWLDYCPPSHLQYGQFLRDHYPWLDRVDVVHTSTLRDVARQAARVLLGLLKEYRGRETVHVGLAGGISLRQAASALASLLCEPIPYGDLPRKVTFHSLVAGFDLHDPTTDPNTFFTFFVDEPGLRIEPSFVGLVAPAVVRAVDYPRLKQIGEIEEAFAAAEDIDIILTSGADWKDEHSLLRRCMKRRSSSLRKLERAGCVGDLLWRPIGPDGPIETRTELRAFTVIELSRIPRMITQGKKVILMLGPCAGCRRPKSGLLRTILDLEEHLVTHLVTDSRSAGELYLYYQNGEGADGTPH